MSKEVQHSTSLLWQIGHAMQSQLYKDLLAKRVCGALQAPAASP